MALHHTDISQNTVRRSAQDWLSRLVAFDSRNGTGDEIALVKYLHDVLATFSPDHITMQTVPRSRGKTDSAYVLAIWGAPRVVLNVHIDTVPSGQGWNADPLTLREDGDRLIGLGSSDIKGAAAAILAALGTTTPQDVAILFSGDEEHGSEVMPAVIASGALRDIPMAIVCEPTSCTVGRRHRGMLAMQTQFTGPGGHSSLSDSTAAPLLQAARLAAAIGDYGNAHRDFGTQPYKGLATNIGQIVGDGAYNVIPTTVDFKFSMRPPPGDNVRGREADMTALAKALYPDNPLDTIVCFSAFESRDVAAFAPVFGDFTPADLPYWTEAAMLSDAGINAVVYGPGDVAQAHKPNEYVTRAQLATAQAAYAKALSGALSS